MTKGMPRSPLKTKTLLLVDIGNTHTHVGFASPRAVRSQRNLETGAWFDGSNEAVLRKLIARGTLGGIAFCSVVPKATRYCREFAAALKVPSLELTSETVMGVGIDYPKPNTIGPDRLANASAAHSLFGAPALVVDFGTAVTFDVVNSSGNYVGGVIAPGLSAMTDYLHEKTALLPRIEIREPKHIIGRNTEEAMLIGAVHGYRGLIRGLVQELSDALHHPALPVIATGGYARLIARKVPEITAVRPNLTLEGLRLEWLRLFQPAGY